MKLERVVTGAIVANAAVFAWGLVDHAHAETADHIEHAILALFVVELAIKVAAQRLAYVKQPWQAFDAVVIVAALLPIAPVGTGLLRLARLASMAHLLRHIQQLRSARPVRGAVAR